jgi:hypothetical protein
MIISMPRSGETLAASTVHFDALMFQNDAASMQHFTSLLHGLLQHLGNGDCQSKENTKRDNMLGNTERVLKTISSREFTSLFIAVVSL